MDAGGEKVGEQRAFNFMLIEERMSEDELSGLVPLHQLIVFDTHNRRLIPDGHICAQ